MVQFYDSILCKILSDIKKKCNKGKFIKFKPRKIKTLVYAIRHVGIFHLL